MSDNVPLSVHRLRNLTFSQGRLCFYFGSFSDALRLGFQLFCNTIAPMCFSSTKMVFQHSKSFKTSVFVAP